MSFPRYPKYKDSGVEWLGEVPAHWDSQRLKRIFELVKRPPADDDEIVTAFRDGIVTLRSNRRTDGYTNALQEHGYQRIHKGDLVIHAMDAFAGAIGVSDAVGKSTPVYSVCVPRRSDVEPHYYGRLLRHVALTGYISALAKGIRERSTEFRWSEAANVVVAVPPLSEQVAIVTFLDREIAKIDALVAEQERLIELLKEKRQAVISHAAIKGLNPDASMKPSGVEWLGEVPAHWRVGKCGHYVSVLSGFAFPSANFSDNPLHHKLLRGINVGVGTLRWDDVVYWEKHSSDGLDEYELRPGELVLGMDRPLIAEGVRVARVEAKDLPCLLLQRVASLRSRGEISVDYLRALLASPMFVAHFAPDTTGVSVPHISPEQIKSFVIPVPPLPEQASIVAYIDEVTSRSEALITEAQCAIDLLQERRTALISAAVTGQIDVRASAHRSAA